MNTIKHWKNWAEQQPQSGEPIAIRHMNQSEEYVVISEQVEQSWLAFHAAGLWWRLWPEDGDL